MQRHVNMFQAAMQNGTQPFKATFECKKGHKVEGLKGCLHNYNKEIQSQSIRGYIWKSILSTWMIKRNGGPNWHERICHLQKEVKGKQQGIFKSNDL